MNLSTYESMDPHLLVGLINTALRNDCDNLEDLVKTHDLNRDTLEKRLGSAGYRYTAEQNQFRPVEVSRRDAERADHPRHPTTESRDSSMS